jgi:hypothetical protein
MLQGVGGSIPPGLTKFYLRASAVSGAGPSTMINHPNRSKVAARAQDAAPRALDFSRIKDAVARQFDRLSQHGMFRVEVEKDDLWSTYLGSFPEGSNPVLRKRTEHDCGCCRQFIRAVGDVVAIIDGKVESLWDVEVGDLDYQAVANAMSDLVQSRVIASPFLHGEHTAGTDKNFEQKEGEPVRTWRHFFVNIPYGRNQGQNYYCAKKDIPTVLGEARALHDVLRRSLNELTVDAVDTVLELIAQNSLYRGQEHQHAVEVFRALKMQYDKLTDDRDAFVWSKIDTVPAAVAKIRNTSIGTLLVDLSEGLELEEAVRKFEAVVAPQNYKRPTALVTKAMVEAAKKKVEELGLTSALDRRYARLEDISVNDIIFADRGARKVMRDVFDAVATKQSTPKDLAKVEVVPIEKFVTEIVPNVDTVEVLFENRHAGNLVSLVAPADPRARHLFKWDNGFSWSYSGDVADSIKERVKKAGGNVTGDLCCRLAWYNYDDLDFHMKEAGGTEIYYVQKQSSATGGRLDVDMNAGSGHTREPVENIFYASRSKMREGAYLLFVHQFCRRESDNIGFEVEVDWLGDVTTYAYAKALRQGENVAVARFRYTHAGGVEIIESLPSSSASRKLWGLDTQGFQRVNLLLRSPNYWSGQGVGNKHYFFMLDGCANDGQARGFYNEFLRTDLDKHRKVLEIVGSKMKTEQSENQLSGLGFSETKRNEVTVRVRGSFNRTLKVLI